MIKDGQSAVNDPDSLHVEIAGSQSAVGLQAVVDVDLPWEFFEGMPESPMPGKVLGIASIVAASGGISEVCTISKIPRIAWISTLQLS